MSSKKRKEHIARLTCGPQPQHVAPQPPPPQLASDYSHLMKIDKADVYWAHPVAVSNIIKSKVSQGPRFWIPREHDNDLFVCYRKCAVTFAPFCCRFSFKLLDLPWNWKLLTDATSLNVSNIHSYVANESLCLQYVVYIVHEIYFWLFRDKQMFSNLRDKCHQTYKIVYVAEKIKKTRSSHLSKNLQPPCLEPKLGTNVSYPFISHIYPSFTKRNANNSSTLKDPGFFFIVSPLPGLGSWTWPWWCDSSRPPASKVVKIPLKMLKAICYLLEMWWNQYEISWNLLKWRSHDANLEIWFQYVAIISKVFRNLQIPIPNLDPRLSLLQCQASSALIKGVSSFRSFSASCSSNNLGSHQLPIFCCFLCSCLIQVTLTSECPHLAPAALCVNPGLVNLSIPRGLKW